jgi:hypothetical protein
MGISANVIPIGSREPLAFLASGTFWWLLLVPHVVWNLFFLRFYLFIYLFIYYLLYDEYTVGVFRDTRRRYQIPLQMVVSHHMAARN